MHILVNYIVFIIIFKESGGNSWWSVTHLFCIISVYKPHGTHHCYQFYTEGTQQHQPCSAVFSSVISAFTELFVVLVAIAVTADSACNTDASIRWPVQQVTFLPEIFRTNSFSADLAQTSLQDGCRMTQKRCSTPGPVLNGNAYFMLGMFLLALPNSYRQDTFGTGINNFHLSFIWKVATD